MEDPWGSSPWAADASSTKLDLPAAPQTAHFPKTNGHLSPRMVSPARRASGTWEDGDDDTWGGWNDATSGKETPGWGRSPGLKPVETSPSLREASPDPWRGIGLEELETTGLERKRGDSETSRDGRVVDSAISFGESGLPGGESLKNSDDVDDVEVVSSPKIGDEDGWIGGKDGPEPSAEWTTSPLSIHVEEPTSPVVAEAIHDVRHEADSIQPQYSVQQVEHKSDVVTEKSESPEIVLTEAEIQAPVEDTAKGSSNFQLSVDEALDVGQHTSEEEVPLEDAKTASDLGSSNAHLSVDEALDVGQHASEEEEVPFENAKTASDLGSKQAGDSNETVELEEPDQPASPAPKPSSSTAFAVDLTKLDDLFPSTPQIDTQPEPLPDTIIDDTFTSSSERKAWYRLSRFGSLRKHDLGDPENYVRVSWAGSQVRDQTTQIVRRWMEQDSITGRVVLGRRLGGNGATMFNWDSEAPEVEIGELLGMHSRAASRDVKSPVVSPTAVTFGWTSSVPSSPTAVAVGHSEVVAVENPPNKPKPIVSEKVVPSVSGTSQQTIQLSSPPARTRDSIAMPFNTSPIPDIDEDANKDKGREDEEDDWGEMVASTPIETAGFAPMEADFANFGSSSSSSSSSSSRNVVSSPQAAPKTSFDDSRLFPLKKNIALKQRPESWHVGQLQQSGALKLGSSPLSPLFASQPRKSESILSQGITAYKAGMNDVVETPVAPLSSPLSGVSGAAAEEDIVKKILGDIPDLSYMLR